MKDQYPLREICRYREGAKEPYKTPCTGEGEYKLQGGKNRIHLVMTID